MAAKALKKRSSSTRSKGHRYEKVRHQASAEPTPVVRRRRTLELTLAQGETAYFAALALPLATGAIIVALNSTDCDPPIGMLVVMFLFILALSVACAEGIRRAHLRAGALQDELDTRRARPVRLARHGGRYAGGPLSRTRPKRPPKTNT